MYNYLPENDTNAERFLVIRLENDPSSDFAHITAHVVRAAVQLEANPDTGYVVYNDGKDASGYRNCSWSSGKKNAMFVEDLFVASQITKRSWSDGTPSEDLTPYGIELCFKPHSVDSREAREMANTFAKVDKKMEKLAQEFGHCCDLATFITRVASVLGIKKFLTYKKNTRDYSLDSANFNVWKATDVNFVVGEFIQEVAPKND